MRTPRRAAIQKRDEKSDAEKLSAAVPPLLLRANQLVKEFNPGVHGRRKAGTGEDFWQFKQYSQDTAASQIDWRQSAKREQLYIRQKELETAESVWFWRDSSPTMQYCSHLASHTKLSQATVLTLAAGLLLAQGGENFGLLGISKRAGHGSVAFDRFSHDLFAQESSDLRSASSQSRLSKNSRIVLISDFLKPLESLEKAIRFFSNNKSRGILLHIADPAEIELPFTGRNRFLGMEEDISLTVGRTEAVREEYQLLFSAHKSALQALARDAGWDYIFYNSGSSLGDALATLYQALKWGG